MDLPVHALFEKYLSMVGTIFTIENVAVFETLPSCRQMAENVTSSHLKNICPSPAPDATFSRNSGTSRARCIRYASNIACNDIHTTLLASGPSPAPDATFPRRNLAPFVPDAFLMQARHHHHHHININTCTFSADRLRCQSKYPTSRPWDDGSLAMLYLGAMK